MSKYTTGELAKLCGVTVRTVQYYDTRGILIPSELSEGGRRLYSEQDVKRMKIICFLRDAGIPLNSIGELLSGDDPARVINLLLDEQEKDLRDEMRQQQERLDRLCGIRRELKYHAAENFSVESIGDIACALENKKLLRRLHRTLLWFGIPLCMLEWTGLLLWITLGFWQLLAAVLLLMIPCSIGISLYYFRRVAYICPQCHEIFRPTLREAFWAPHTPALRKLRCHSCGYEGFCVEIYQEKGCNKQDASN